jgi:hypothetical protein
MRRDTWLQNTLGQLCANLAPGVLVETQRLQNLDRMIAHSFPSGNSLSYAALFVLEYVLDRAVQLVVLGHNAAAYVECHAALERYVVEAIPKALGRDERSRNIIALLIDRKTLSELAPHLVTMGRWKKADLVFVRRLARIRNGVVHRNEAALRQFVGGTLEGHRGESLVRLNRMDASDDLVETLKLMIGATRFRRRSKKRARAGSAI